MTFAEKLKSLRKQASMSQEQLAESSVYQDRLSQNGKPTPAFPTLKILSPFHHCLIFLLMNSFLMKMHLKKNQSISLKV